MSKIVRIDDINAPSEDVVFWKLNLDPYKNSVTKKFDVDALIVNIPEGLVLIEFRNNKFFSINVSNEYKIKTRPYDKTNVVLDLYVCTQRLFEIPFGAGGIVYEDETLNIKTTLGGHGYAKVLISSPKLLCRTLGKTMVTIDDIAEIIRQNFLRVFRPTIYRYASNLRYKGVVNQIDKISQDITTELKRQIMFVGVEVKEFNLREIKFTDDKLNKLINEKFDKDAEEMNDIKNYINAVNTISNPETRICPNCKNVISATTKMCTKCGTLLD